MEETIGSFVFMFLRLEKAFPSVTSISGYLVK